MNAPTRETATIIAALRLVQIVMQARLPNPEETEMLRQIEHSAGDPLSSAEIDAVIDHLVMSADASRQIIAQIRTVIADPGEDETTGPAKVEALLTQLEALL